MISCAWSPTRCATMSFTGMSARRSRCCRASRARFSARRSIRHPSPALEPGPGGREDQLPNGNDAPADADRSSREPGCDRARRLPTCGRRRLQPGHISPTGASASAPASIPTVRERSSQPGAKSTATRRRSEPRFGRRPAHGRLRSAFRRPALRLRNRSSRSTGAGTPSPSGTGRSRAATVSLKQPRGRRAEAECRRADLTSRRDRLPRRRRRRSWPRNHRLHGVDELPSGRPCGLSLVGRTLGCSCHDLGSSEQHLHPDRGDG